MSTRARFALSYAGITAASGVLLLCTVWAFLWLYADELFFQSSSRSPQLLDVALVAAIAVTLLTLLGFCAGWLLTGPMLAPATTIRNAAQLVAQGSLSHRIALPGRKDEFHEIAEAFNSMLDKLEAQLDEQQRFAANASHELRTPLATSRTLLEVARTDPAPDVAVLVSRLEELNAKAIRLTEALLLLSQVGQHSIAEDVDLSLIAEEAAEDLFADAERHRVRLEVDCDEAVLRGSPTLLHQLVIGLVGNAIVHNLAEGGVVWVRTRGSSEGVLLEVENTGAPALSAQVATWTELFQRQAGRTRNASHDGFGLGLAIAQRITQAHRGSLHLDPRKGGGLTVKVVLPRPDR